MELTIKGIVLIQKTLTFNGQKQVDPRTQAEVEASRTLNGEESAQRRHFNKNVKEIIEDYNKAWKEISKGHNDYIKEVTKEVESENPKKEKEEDEKYKVRINGLIFLKEEVKEKLKETQEAFNALDAVKHTFEITSKTQEVAKRYFKEYGNEAGFEAKDDETVEEVTAVL